MKPLTLHPGSALAGAGVLALVLLGTGIAASQDAPQRAMPNYGNLVVIRQGTPYTVPEGKVLIVTMLGANTVSGYSELLVNEVVEIGANTMAENGTTMTPLPAKYYVPGGAVVSVQNSQDGAGRAWGSVRSDT